MVLEVSVGFVVGGTNRDVVVECVVGLFIVVSVRGGMIAFSQNRGSDS
jgi:hypothetical protein